MARLKAARQAPWQVEATAHATVSEDGQQGRADENNGRECGGRGGLYGETVKPRLFIRQVCTASRGSARVTLKVCAWAWPEPTHSLSAAARAGINARQERRETGALPHPARALSATHSPLGDGHGALPREVVKGAGVRRPRRLPTRCQARGRVAVHVEARERAPSVAEKRLARRRGEARVEKAHSAASQHELALLLKGAPARSAREGAP